MERQRVKQLKEALDFQRKKLHAANERNRELELETKLRAVNGHVTALEGELADMKGQLTTLKVMHEKLEANNQKLKCSLALKSQGWLGALAFGLHCGILLRKDR